jgi:hypothetical protein
LTFADPRAFYDSELQSLWALIVPPALWLGARLLRGRPRAAGVDPAGARFVLAFGVVFAVETILDPLATGPLAARLGGSAGSGLGLLFVLLGDFRVFLLVCYLAGGRRRLRTALLEALLLTPVVPAFAFSAERIVRAAVGPVPDGVLWLLHETAFLAMVFYLRREVVAARAPLPETPRERFLRAVTRYVATYYALWAACDALLLLGFDWPWVLRALPNQLYYAWFVPFVHWRFFAPSNAAARSSVQASR